MCFLHRRSPCLIHHLTQRKPQASQDWKESPKRKSLTCIVSSRLSPECSKGRRKRTGMAYHVTIDHLLSVCFSEYTLEEQLEFSLNQLGDSDNVMEIVGNKGAIT